MKKTTDKLKVLFAYEIWASAVKATSSINEIMSRKFHLLSSRLDEIDIKVTEKKLADSNKVRTEQYIRRKIS